MSYFYIEELLENVNVLWMSRAAGAALLNSVYSVYYDLFLCQRTWWPSNKRAAFIFSVISVIGRPDVTMLCKKEYRNGGKLDPVTFKKYVEENTVKAIQMLRQMQTGCYA